MSVYALSAAQRRLWSLAALEPGSGAYRNTYLIRFSGPLDVGRLTSAIERIVARHESLRMSFKKSEFLADNGVGKSDALGDDGIVAVVAAAGDVVLPTIDVSDLAAPEYAGYEQRFITDFARERFDLSTGPLLRAALLHFDATYHVLGLVVHHIVWDRWSFGIFCRELATFYRTADRSDATGLGALRIGYGQCAQDAPDDDAELALVYWRTLLSGERETLSLPLDRPRPAVASHCGAVVALGIEADLVGRLSDLASTHGATKSNLLFTAFLVLLQRYSGQTEVLVGTPVARRGRIEGEPLLGLFVNTLPLCIRMTPDETFAAVLLRVRTATVEMLAHADVPFDRLVREELGGRESGRNPFFDVLFNFQDTPNAAVWPADIGVQTEEVDSGASGLDLAAVLRPQPDGTLLCRFEYSLDVFEPATIGSMAQHFRVLLDAIVADPGQGIGRLAIAGTTEIDTIARRWSAPAVPVSPLPLAGSAATIHALVEQAAARDPAAVALIEDGCAPVTYGELDRRANALAHRLRAAGVARDVRVGLFLGRAASTIVAMVATLKAGGAFVPLDPAYPPERTAYMLAAADVRLVVTGSQTRAAAAGFGLPVFDLDDVAQSALPGEGPPPGIVNPDDLAYVMFTSGSTGTPKAVAVEHRGVVALVTMTPELACTPADVALFHAPLTFDASAFAWGYLAYGARVAVMPAGPFSLAELGGRIVTSGTTLLELSPALFHQLVEEQIDDLRGLRRCNVGGDVLSPAHCATFVNAVPGCRLFNGYGPTEATVIATLAEIRPGADTGRPVPIGFPIAQARIYILDDRRSPVAIGVPGELCIGGPGVARCYLNDPVLTAQRFVPDPFAADERARMYRTGDRARWLPSGEIEFLGRADAQLKIRGFRIEPAEIEFALLEHAAVRKAAVSVRGMELAERRLIAYAEVRDGVADEAQLRAFLAAKLPPHAVPARIVLMETLPLTSSGKLDRSRLPEPPGPGRDSACDDTPQSEIERTLATMIAALFKIERIGRNDDFFALGGHSLLAMRIISRIADAFDIDVSLREFFAAPTVAGLAARLAHLPRRAAAPASLTAAPADELEARLASLSPAELDALLAQTLEARDVPPVRFRCVLIGGSTLVLRCAQTLQKRGHAVVAVFVANDLDVAAWASEHAVPCFDSTDALAGVLHAGDVDYLFSVINLHVLSPAVLACVKRAAINVHDGPLPRYGGRFATTFAIAAGEREHGITWHEMTQVIDGGRILKQEHIAIGGAETAFTLNLKCYDAALASFVELVGELEAGRSAPREQSAQARTYYRVTDRLSPACIIDFERPAAAVSAFVRALDFGPTRNLVGRPKIVVGDTAYCCGRLDVLAEAASGSPGEIVRLESDAIVVTTTDRLVRLRAITTLADEVVSIADIVTCHGTRRGDRLAVWPESVAATIARLDLAAVSNELFWAQRLAALDVPELLVGDDGDTHARSLEVEAQGVQPGRLEIECGGADEVALGAFSVALASHTAARQGDIFFVAADRVSGALPLVDALFAVGLPMRIVLDPTRSLESAARDLRGRIAEITRRGTYARDIFARFPELRTVPACVKAGAYPIALAFTGSDTFATAAQVAQLTFLVEQGGTRAAVLHDGAPRSKRLAQRLAKDIPAIVNASRGAVR